MYTVTDGEGKYNLYLQEQDSEYNYSTLPILYHETICENTNEGAIQISAQSNDTLNIPFHPIAGLTDLVIDTWNTSPFRPGFTTAVNVKVTNVGNVDVNDATVSLSYNPEYQIVLSASGGTETNLGLWSFPISVETGTSEIFTLNLEVLATTPLGTELTYIAEVENIGDETPLNNTAQFTRTVIGSYDPNDKTLMTATSTLPLTENELTYRIRFQNTGTDTAFRVIVLDTLPQNLDLLSLQMIDASHDYNLEIKNPRILEWTFNDILLPDSTTNEAMSHGYVLFKINTLDTLIAGEMLPNDAAIYFDFNAPVITNEVIITIEKGEIENLMTVEICEGEEWNGITINESTIFSDTLIGEVYDTIFTTEVTALPAYEESVLVSGEAGLFIDGIQIFSDSTFSHLYETIEGCDSLVHYSVDILSRVQNADSQEIIIAMFPNPSSSNAIINIFSTEKIIADIDVLSSKGELLFNVLESQNIGRDEFSFILNIESLSTGVYYLQVSTKVGVRYLKFVKI